jgi:hypothetical protein
MGMTGEPSSPGGAVFLSCASEDTDAAPRICEALRSTGIEVWFDKSELRGGDVWDQSIRRQIKNCALFIPVISINTDAWAEGYFRIDWKLAVDRSHPKAWRRAHCSALHNVGQPFNSYVQVAPEVKTRTSCGSFKDYFLAIHLRPLWT